jgi:hypothetical protein
MLQENKQYKFTKNGNSFVGTPLDIDETKATVKVERILTGEITSEQVNDEFVEKKEDQVVKVGDVAVFNIGDWGWKVDIPQAAAGGARKRRRSSKRRSNKRKSNKRKSYRGRRN